MIDYRYKTYSSTMLISAMNEFYEHKLKYEYILKELEKENLTELEIASLNFFKYYECGKLNYWGFLKYSNENNFDFEEYSKVKIEVSEYYLKVKDEEEKRFIEYWGKK